MKRSAFFVLLGLSACMSAPDQGAVVSGDLPPIARDYRTRIVDWARGYYAQPRSLRNAEISDPVLIRDGSGRLLWLVCIGADALAADGRPLLPRRQAFGFAPNYVSVPLERNGSWLHPGECDRPLVWTSWPALARL